MNASLVGAGRPIACPFRQGLASLVIMAVLGSCAAPASHSAAAPARQPAGTLSTPAAVPGSLGSVRLGGEVDGLAAGGGYLWAFVRDSGTLVQVDQRSGQVQRFALAAWRGLPTVIAATADGVWLASQASTDVIKVDPRTGRIVARPHLPGNLGSVTDLTTAYGWLWVLVPDRASPPGWRVIQVNPATSRVEGISADTPGTQLTGHTAAISASAGKLWVTGSMNVIVSLDPGTLAMHRTAITTTPSEGLAFGDGHAWELNSALPALTEIDPRTGQVVRTLTTPPSSPTGDVYVVAGQNLLWLFQGSQLSEMNPVTGRVITSTRVFPIGPALYSRPAVVSSNGLWYLAQTSNGIVLDHICKHGSPHCVAGRFGQPRDLLLPRSGGNRVSPE